jgi:hypothetical protein
VSARTLLAGGLAAGFVAAVVLRPLAHGVPGTTVAVFWATVLGQVVVPGVLLCHGARLCGRRDPWLVLGQGATVGVAIQGLAMLAGRALGEPWLPSLAALSAAAAGLALGRRGAARTADGPAPAPAHVLSLAIVLLAVLIQPLASTARLGEPVPFDLLFHAGTAGELRHRWPLEDPRVAGVPLHYHLLSYALPVEAAEMAGSPLFDPLLALAPLFWVALLGLQLSNAGRLLFEDGRAGALGAGVALLHADPGRLLSLGPGAFNNHLATGIFGSPTTVCGLVLLAGIAIALEEWMERGAPRSLGAFSLLAAAASGAKTTVMPVVLGGLIAAAALDLVRRDARRLHRWGAALVVGAGASAPLTVWQTGGEATYSAMARFGPGAAFAGAPAVVAAERWLGPEASPIAAVPLFVAWLTGHLGLAGVGTATWLARREGPASPGQSWALGVAAVGLATSLLVDAPGLSQLFLLYNGQVLLGLFAGAALARLTRRPWRATDAAAGALLLLASLPAVHHVGRALPAALRADVGSSGARASPLARDYLEGLAWLRTRAARDAVVFADNPSLALSAFGEVRLFHETSTYTARAWQEGPPREPWPERVALQERLLRRPDATAIAEARRAIGPGPRLLVVADAVPTAIEAGYVWIRPAPVPPRRLLPEPLFERLFANAAIHVYEAREPG